MPTRRYRRYNHARNAARRSSSQHGHEQQLRLRVAQEAARIISEEGIADYSLAKRKAGAHFGMAHQGQLPSNLEIEQALLEYQRLFRPDEHQADLRVRRELALQAMDLLERFSPRLVGGVLSGAAGEHAAVQLHLFAGTPEEVAIVLQERRIPYDLQERVLRIGSNLTAPYPVYEFVAGQVPVQLTVFPPEGLRQSPLSPVDARPMKRADRAAVQALLGEHEPVLGRDLQTL